MKNNVLKVLLIVIILCGLCGCAKQEEQKTEQQKTEQQYGKFKEKINCEELNEIKISDTIGFLTESGNYYYFGNFSDGTNCKKVEIENEIVKFASDNGDTILFDNENRKYRLVNQKISEIDNFDGLWRAEALSTDNNAIKSTNGPASVVGYYVLRNDGIIYLLNMNNEELDRISIENEIIMDFYASGLIKWIKTNKSYYMRKVKDEKCFQHDDIKCEYEYIKDEKLTSHYDDIAFFDDENVVVLKDGNSYFLND